MSPFSRPMNLKEIKDQGKINDQLPYSDERAIRLIAQGLIFSAGTISYWDCKERIIAATPPTGTTCPPRNARSPRRGLGGKQSVLRKIEAQNAQLWSQSTQTMGFNEVQLPYPSRYRTHLLRCSGSLILSGMPDPEEEGVWWGSYDSLLTPPPPCCACCRCICCSIMSATEMFSIVDFCLSKLTRMAHRCN